MKSIRPSIAPAMILLFSVVPAAAHHSAAQFDMSRTVAFDAIVTDFEWKNPHVFVHVDRTDDNGDMSDLQIEADGVSMLVPHGWSRESLDAGDRVRVEAYPPKDPARRAMLGYSITKQDGTVLAPNPDRFSAALPVSAERAAGIEGVWLPRWDAFFNFRNGSWPRTEQGQRFVSLPESERNPLYDCVPYATPRIMVIPVHTEIEVLSDRVLIRVDWLDVERVVYTDGRGHPNDGERTIQGHTIGHWEGDTLVMDTTAFSLDSIGDAGYATGPDKHIEERLSLGDDGKTLTYEFTLEDSENLLGPVTGRGIWDYRPDLKPSTVECYLDAARRSLDPVD